MGLVLGSHGARLGVFASEAAFLSGLEARMPCRFGAGVRPIESDDPADEAFDEVFRLERLADAPPRNGAGARGAMVRLYQDEALLQSSRDLAALHERLESELDFSLATHARTALFVHAGVVGWGERAIVIPGRSGSGKTSLVRALVDAGAEYYSDEYAILDAEGLVHPYPRPLGVRGPRGRYVRVPAETLGCRIGERPLRVGAIVSTRFEKGAVFEPRVVGPARGLLALVDNTVLIRERPRFALDCLAPAARGARVLAGNRGEAAEAAERILNLDLRED